MVFQGNDRDLAVHAASVAQRDLTVAGIGIEHEDIHELIVPLTRQIRKKILVLWPVNISSSAEGDFFANSPKFILERGHHFSHGQNTALNPEQMAGIVVADL